MRSDRNMARWSKGALVGAALALVAVAPGAASLARTASAQSAAAQPTVAVTGGIVAGARADSGDALIFRGIPFAAPPTGKLRWRAPQPVVAWSGTRQAVASAPACLQNDAGWNHSDYIHASEDCLTLDVRTPALTGKRPVMVWIHGGSNKAGSARGMVDSHITDQGVVLVAIQYRLSIFGFLSPRGAAAEAGGHAGNYGLMDQIAALRWVQKNIAKFGGDPANVTIFGESAGSQDVSLMLAAPQARGLFKRAIMESGTPDFGMVPRSQDEAFKIADQADKLLGTDGSIAQLRRVSPNALLDADLKLSDDKAPNNGFIWLRTTVDGTVLPDTPRRLLALAPAKPVIVGTNRAEFTPDAGAQTTPHRIANVYGENAAKATALYDFGGADHDPRLGSEELEIGTDHTFRCPANNLATLLAQQGWPVWRYEFDLSPDGGLTSHAKEIGYVMNAIPMASGVSLQDYWTDFAKTGNPNGASLPQWPQWKPSDKGYVLFDKDGVTGKSDLREPFCALMPNRL